MLNKSKILIAGATGLVGTHLIEQVLTQYPQVIIRATYHKAPPAIRHARIEYVQADLTRAADCRRSAAGCDCAILAAAATGGIAATTAAPHLQMTTNLVMDALLLENLHNANINRVVFISSATVYQAFDGFIKEDQLDLNASPQKANLGAGLAKRFAEGLCRFWHEQHGMEIIVVRAANIYGPGDRFDPQQSNFIPALVRKAVEKMDPFEVWGSMEVARDVIYAADFARAVISLLENTAITYDSFNLGSGNAVSVGQVVELALKAAGHSPNQVVQIQPTALAAPFRGLDCTKIKAAIDWFPLVDLPSGIENTVRWWQANKDGWQK